MQQLELTNMLYVSADGLLSFQHPSAPVPRPLSAIQRLQINDREVAGFIQFVTGMTEEQHMEMCMLYAIEWLSRYVVADEAQVYRLLADSRIAAWWRSHWSDNNEGFVGILARVYENIYAAGVLAGEGTDKVTTSARRVTLDKYTKLQQLVFVEKSVMCRSLEDSYSKLW